MTEKEVKSIASKIFIASRYYSDDFIIIIAEDMNEAIEKAKAQYFGYNPLFTIAPIKNYTDCIKQETKENIFIEGEYRTIRK